MTHTGARLAQCPYLNNPTAQEKQLAGYFIRIDERHIPDLAQFLAQRDVEFDPVNNLTACHQELFMDKIWTGHYGQTLIDHINDHFEVPSHLQIKTTFAEMTPSQQWSVLIYATLHCEWKVDYDETKLEYTGIEELEKLKAKYPPLFA